MDYLIVCGAALVTSGLTLFSGFGLGTLLMPAFAIFFPVHLAVALTAVVHLLNNLFKVAIFGRHSDLGVLLRFGPPAIVAAMFGAYVLTWFSAFEPLAQYTLGPTTAEILPVKVLIAVLMLVFAIFEISPRLQDFTFEKRHLVFGGALSGFFGGLSGHQGALRSAFLVKSGLTKEAFIGTGVVISCLVDVARLSIYATHYLGSGLMQNTTLLAAATGSAFLGVFAGSRLVKKVTMRFIQYLVATMLFLLALGLGVGVV